MSKKVKYSIVIISIIVIIITLMIATNLSNIISYDNPIPKESNVFDFEITDSTFDQWIYGEDKLNYYFYFSEKVNDSDIAPYIYVSKQYASKIIDFDNNDYHTWNLDNNTLKLIYFLSKDHYSKKYYLDSLNVISTNGVVLRKEPSVKSDKIMNIDFLENVYVLKYSEHKDTINKITSRWAYIIYNNNGGWIFAGYLKKELPYNEQSIKDFFNSPFLNINIKNITTCGKHTIIKEFGEPISIKINNVFNGMSGKTDNFITLTYNNVIFTIRHMGLDGRDWMINYVIKDNTFPLKRDIKIGDKLDNLIEHFGYPRYDMVNKCFCYGYDEGFNSAKIFVDENMNISRIEVDTYLD